MLKIGSAFKSVEIGWKLVKSGKTVTRRLLFKRGGLLDIGTIWPFSQALLVVTSTQGRGLASTRTLEFEFRRTTPDCALPHLQRPSGSSALTENICEDSIATENSLTVRVALGIARNWVGRIGAVSGLKQAPAHRSVGQYLTVSYAQGTKDNAWRAHRTKARAGGTQAQPSSRGTTEHCRDTLQGFRRTQDSSTGTSAHHQVAISQHSGEKTSSRASVQEIPSST